MTEQTLEEALTNPDFLIDLATRLKEEQQARLAAESQVKQQQPLVQFAETCMSSKNSIRVREMAKLASKNGINIGQNRLFAKLREWG
ncbi:phage antirepressor KilAC domain-containing protein [Paenibacillus thiaminolyticus]